MLRFMKTLHTGRRTAWYTGQRVDGHTYYGHTYYGCTHYGHTYYGHTYYGHTYYGYTFYDRRRPETSEAHAGH